MNILFITHHLPYPPLAGARLRNYQLLKRLGEENAIWLAVLSHDDHSDPDHIRALKEVCRDVQVFHEKDRGALARPIEGIGYLLAGMPPDLRFFKSKAMSGYLRKLTGEVSFDAIEIVFSYMARFIEDLPQDLWSKTILTFIDVLFSKYDRISRVETRLARRMREQLDGRMMHIWEPRYAERFGRCGMMSRVEMELLRSANPRLRMEVVPNGVDIKVNQVLPETSEKPCLVFVGNMDYAANVDAMLFFVRDILPLVRKEIPETEMWVVGVNPRKVITAMDGNGIHVTGKVEDVQPYYQQSRVCVIPLRAGAGTRLKILESMALGRPVVSTSIGYEGIEAVDGEHLLVADTAEEFARKTIQLLKDEELRKHLVRNARKLVVDLYDWDIIARNLSTVYSRLSTHGK